MFQKRPFDKKILTYSEQVELLKSRGMSFDDVNKSIELLEHRNYYRLSAYWFDKYQDSNSNLFNGISFEDISRVYEFDRKLRILILELIERLEISLRANLSYIFAHSTKNSHPHLDRGNFSGKYYDSNIIKIKNEVQRSSRTELFIDHCLKTYQEELPPLWVCSEVMSLGSLSKFFSVIKSGKIKNKIAKIYSVQKDFILSSWLKCLTELRNFCAHHSRVYNRVFPSAPHAPLTGNLSQYEKLLNNNWNCSLRQSKIYNLLLCLFYLTNDIPGAKRETIELKQFCINNLEYCEEMGFPENFQQLSFWSNITTLHSI